MKLTVKKEEKLIDFLREKLDSASKTKILKMLRHDGVLVQGQAVSKATRLLKPGQVVEIRKIGAKVKQESDAQKGLPILLEDDYLIALEKPPGLLSISTDDRTEDTFYEVVYAYVKAVSHGKDRIFIVHRLDRDISGVMLFAKSPEIKEQLQSNWKETEKVFTVLVEGIPTSPEGTIKSWLKENRIRKAYTTEEGPHAEWCVTHYTTIQTYAKYALLEVRTENNRKDQIRAHLSEQGHPVVGDKKYGATLNPIHRLAMHATSLRLVHPGTGEQLQLVSPTPKIFKTFAKNAIYFELKKKKKVASVERKKKKDSFDGKRGGGSYSKKKKK